MTYNSKTNKVLVAGPYEYEKVYLYNGDSLKREKEYPKEKYPSYNAIGYDDIDDLYIGHSGKKIFMADTVKMEKLNEFGLAMFEAGQDLEYHDGYVFYCTSDLGAPSKYQTYSFYKKGDNISDMTGVLGKIGELTRQITENQNKHGDAISKTNKALI